MLCDEKNISRLSVAMMKKMYDGLQNLTIMKISLLLLKTTVSWEVKSGLFKMIQKYFFRIKSGN